MTAVEEQVGTDQLLDIPVAAVRTSSDNPRSDVGDIDDLATSIAEVGVVQPLVVRPCPGEDGTYVLIAGERRLAASKRAGLDVVPCIVRDLDDEAALEQTIVENLHRLDVSPVDEASGYAHLARLGRTQQEIAERVGRSQSHISKRLALLLLPEIALQELADGHLTVSQAEVLATVRDDDARMSKLLGLIGRQNFDAVLRAEVGEYQREAERRSKIAVLEEAGVEVLLTYSVAQILGHLSGVIVDQEAHAAEPCHAACVDHNNRVVLLCTDRARHAPDGVSDLKASNLTPKAPTPDDADAPRSTSSGAPSPSGATGAASAGGPGAPDGSLDEPEQTVIEVPKSPQELEREANRARLEAFEATRTARRQRMIDHLAKAKPSKRDLVKLLAGQLTDDGWVHDIADDLAELLSLPGAEGEVVDWHTCDIQESIDALSAYVAKGDAQADRFLLAFTLELVESAFDSMARLSRYQGVEPGRFADDTQVRRHYDFLRDIGWKPTPAEQALLEAPSGDDEDDDERPADSTGITDGFVDPDLDEILDALATLKVAFYAGADDSDIDEQRFVDAGEAAAIEAQGLSDRLHRIEVTEADDEGPTDAELVPWDAPDDFGRDGDDAIVESAADVAPSADAVDSTTIATMWSTFLDTVGKARESKGNDQKVWTDATTTARTVVCNAIASSHPDPAAGATALSMLYAGWRTEIDTNGTAKSVEDIEARFRPYRLKLVELIEAGGVTLPEPYRTETIEADGISFNQREGCPAGDRFPRLRVEDLIDAYSRRVES